MGISSASGNTRGAAAASPTNAGIRLGTHRHSPRAVESALPEARIQCGNLDLASAPRRMDELVVAEIDADVGEREPPGVEEHEIARLQIGDGDVRAEAAHVLRSARERHSRHLLEDITDESAAIEARLRSIAAPLVPDADQIEGGGGKILGRFERVHGRALDPGRSGTTERHGGQGGLVLREDGGGSDREARDEDGHREPAMYWAQKHAALSGNRGLSASSADRQNTTVAHGTT